MTNRAWRRIALLGLAAITSMAACGSSQDGDSTAAGAGPAVTSSNKSTSADTEAQGTDTASAFESCERAAFDSEVVFSQAITALEASVLMEVSAMEASGVDATAVGNELGRFGAFQLADRGWEESDTVIWCVLRGDFPVPASQARGEVEKGDGDGEEAAGDGRTPFAHVAVQGDDATTIFYSDEMTSPVGREDAISSLMPAVRDWTERGWDSVGDPATEDLEE